MFFNKLHYLTYAVCMLTGCSGLGVTQDVLIRNRFPSTSTTTRHTLPSSNPSPLLSATPPVSQTQTTATSSSPSEEVKTSSMMIDLHQINTKETAGNNDNVINRGESFRLQPILINKGKAISNELTLRFSSLDPNLQIIRNNYTIKPVYPNEISQQHEISVDWISANNQYFEIKINNDFEAGSIPVNITVSDKFGNSWKLSSDIEVKLIDNQVQLLNMQWRDENSVIGQISTKLISISNTGGSDTNDLSLKIVPISGIREVVRGDSRIGKINSGSTYINEWVFGCGCFPLVTLNFVQGTSNASFKVIFYDKYGNQWESEKKVALEWGTDDRGNQTLRSVS